MGGWTNRKGEKDLDQSEGRKRSGPIGREKNEMALTNKNIQASNCRYTLAPWAIFIAIQK